MANKKDLGAPLLGLGTEAAATTRKNKVDKVSSRSSGASRSHRSNRSNYGGVTRTPRKTPKAFGNTGPISDNALTLGIASKFEAGLKSELLNEAKADKEKFKRELEDQRNKDANDFKNNNKKAANNIIFPEYEIDDRLNVFVEKENKIPPDSLFMGVGYDSDPEAVVDA